MQAICMTLEWQHFNAAIDPNSRLSNERLPARLQTLREFLLGDKEENLGGAPAEFLPQMLLEIKPVRVCNFPIQPIDMSQTSRVGMLSFLLCPHQQAIAVKGCGNPCAELQ